MTRESPAQGGASPKEPGHHTGHRQSSGTLRLDARTVAGTSYGRAALSSAIDRIETAPGGHRHKTVFAASAAVGQVLASGELADEIHAAALLVDMARRIGIDDPQRQVQRGIARGRTTPRQAPDTRMVQVRTDVVERVVAWWDAVQTDPPSGAAAATTLRVLAAFAMVAARSGKLRVSESYRQIAEAAGVSVATVAKHRTRWQPYVRVHKRGNRHTGTATVWQLVLREGNNPACPGGKPSGLFPRCNTLTDPSHDFWYLWPNGWRLFCLLDFDEPTPVAELAGVTGLSRSTVHRALVRLAESGVVARDDSGWRAVTIEVPSGFTRKRRQRIHANDRELWRSWRRHEAEQREDEGVAS